MDRIDMLNLRNKLERYDKLENSIEELTGILNLPKYIDGKYHGNENIRIELKITYGNGSDSHEFVIMKDTLLGKQIYNELLKEKERLEEELKEL